jgi:hypothetical protein
MLGPDTYADQARWNASQYWKPGEHPNQERGLEYAAAFEHARDDPILDRDLESLRDSRRQFPAPLNVSEMINRQLLRAQSFG